MCPQSTLQYVKNTVEQTNSGAACHMGVINSSAVQSNFVDNETVLPMMSYAIDIIKHFSARSDCEDVNLRICDVVTQNC